MGVFELISRYGTRIIALSAVAGIVFPDAASALRPRLGDFVILMLITSLLRVDFDAFVARLRRPVPALASAGWIIIVAPLLVLTAGLALAPPEVAVALTVLFLFSAPPPIVSAPAFAMLMGLDGAMVLAVMLIATLLVPLTAPWIASVFLADALPIGAFDLAVRLAFIIGTALVAATVLRRVLGKARIDAAKPVLDTLSVTIAILFAIGAMDGVGVRLAEDTAFTLIAAAAAFLFMLGQCAVTYVAFRPFVGRDAVAIAYAAGNRNAGLIVAGLGVTAVDDTVWLFFALSQLPIFIFPLLLTGIGQRLSSSAADPPRSHP